jgi:putative two-component system hydrogenase maturation factor HypX/HoxX
MSRDMYGDRSGFAAARHAFVTKAKPTGTPARLLAPSRKPAVAASRPRVTNDRRATAVRPAVPLSA